MYCVFFSSLYFFVSVHDLKLVHTNASELEKDSLIVFCSPSHSNFLCGYLIMSRWDSFSGQEEITYVAILLKKRREDIVFQDISAASVWHTQTGAYVLENVGLDYFTSVLICYFCLIINTIRGYYKTFGDWTEIFNDLVLAQKSSTAFSHVTHLPFCIILCLKNVKMH